MALWPILTINYGIDVYTSMHYLVASMHRWPSVTSSRTQRNLYFISTSGCVMLGRPLIRYIVIGQRYE